MNLNMNAKDVSCVDTTRTQSRLIYKMTFRDAGVIMRITMSPTFNSTAFRYLKSLLLNNSSVIFQRFGRFEVQSSFLLRQELRNMNKAAKSLPRFILSFCK